MTGGYNERQRGLHDEIIRLRDKCLAHFGAGDDLWHDERVLYFATDKGNGVTMAHRRINFRQDTIDILDELLDTALPHLNTLQGARADDLNTVLQDLPADLNQSITEATFEPGEFFGVDTAAFRQFWDEHGFYEDYTKSI